MKRSYYLQLREYYGGLSLEMSDGSSTVAQQNFNSYDGQGFEILYYGRDELGAIAHDHFDSLEQLEVAMREIAPLSLWKFNR